MFEVRTTKSIDKNKIKFDKKGCYDFIGRSNTNNGVQGTVKKLPYAPNPKGTFSLVQVGESVCLYRNREWYASQNIFILIPKNKTIIGSHLFVVAAINKALCKYESAYIYPTIIELRGISIKLPTQNCEIDFNFMESFITELEAELIAELYDYLSVSGLDNYELTEEEENAITDFNSYKWSMYNLEKLFGKSTRGKRLKSADRIQGTLPFVTAGEAEEGISAYISNEVEIFSENTTTIDMFGSAKYRSYKYGADDHVAVVHTENVPKNAAIFITAAIHKAAHTGKFNYSKNFYAKDADELNISLPTKGGKPDFSAMGLLISAIQKLVIKDVVLYADKKLALTKEIVDKPR